MRMDVLEQLLNEGQAVDNEVNAVLRKAGVSDIDGLRNRLYQLRWVKNSPNNKDAVPTVKWIADFAKEKGLPIEERWRDLFKWVWAIIRKKNRLNTTKNRALVDIWKEYPTFREFEEYIDDEEQKLVNGWKDDFGGQAEVVDDDPDEVRMQRIRQDLGKPTFSTPGVVDIYRADTQAEAIRLGKGYSWCISYTTGDNYFYHYRLNPESTAYFCFFKEPQPEYDDVACVIHVGKNGKKTVYRMTNAQNDNGSPIVDEERVVYCYPPLDKWLPSMTVTPLSNQERDFAYLKKQMGSKWLDVSAQFLKDHYYSRSDLRMLLSMGAGLSDEAFDYILNKYDHGKFNDKDSLINLYTKVTVYPLTKHQEEIIGKNKSLLNFYKERHEGKVEELAKTHMESLIADDNYDDVTHTIGDGTLTFIADVPEYPIEDYLDEVTVSPICQSTEGIPSARRVIIKDNKYIQDITDVKGGVVDVSHCNGVVSGDIVCGSLNLEHCPKLKILFLESFDSWYENDIEIGYCPKLEEINLKYFSGIGDEYPVIGLRALPELVECVFPENMEKLLIYGCPKCDIVKSLKGVTSIKEAWFIVKSYQELVQLGEATRFMEINPLTVQINPNSFSTEEWQKIKDYEESYNEYNNSRAEVTRMKVVALDNMMSYESLSLHPLRRALNNLID